MAEVIRMAHGSGGRLMHRLIAEVFREAFGEGGRDDAAELEAGPGTLAFTTDGFVVQPLFFPGGDIGRLAVCGTVNDLATRGAAPEFLAAAFILEEGLEVEVVSRVAASMAAAAREAGARIVTGDTKVVGRGQADGLFVTTTGVGRIPKGVRLTGEAARQGDVVAVTGALGDHGTAVLCARQGLSLGPELRSDCAPLGGLVAALLAAGVPLKALRDPTRGGLATTLVEIAHQSGVRIVLEEAALPVRPAVAAACELLGLDPLYVACEGRMAAVLPAGAGAAFLAAARAHPLGTGAALVGRVEVGEPGLVLATAVGGRRPLLMLEGDPLPRIC